MIWFVGGINGTGKSTFASSPRVLARMGVRGVRNPDQLAREIANIGIEYGLANLAAANITQGETYDAATTRNQAGNFAIETVLSSGKYDAILDISEQRGTPVGLVFIGVRSVDVVLARISTRVAAGLHDVPESRVRQRWAKTHQSLSRWAPRVDRLFVYANNSPNRAPVLVAKKTAKHGAIQLYDRQEVPDIVAALESCGAQIA